MLIVNLIHGSEPNRILYAKCHLFFLLLAKKKSICHILCNAASNVTLCIVIDSNLNLLFRVFCPWMAVESALEKRVLKTI